MYRWWPNKAAVVIEAFREGFASQLPFPETGSFRDDIKTQVLQFARVLSGSAGRMLSEFIIAARTDPDVAHAFRTLWSDIRRAEARQVLNRHKARGQMRSEVDPDLLLDGCMAAIFPPAGEERSARSEIRRGASRSAVAFYCGGVKWSGNPAGDLFGMQQCFDSAFHIGKT